MPKRSIYVLLAVILIVSIIDTVALAQTTFLPDAVASVAVSSNLKPVTAKQADSAHAALKQMPDKSNYMGIVSRDYGRVYIWPQNQKKLIALMCSSIL